MAVEQKFATNLNAISLFFIPIKQLVLAFCANFRIIVYILYVVLHKLPFLKSHGTYYVRLVLDYRVQL